MARHVECRDRSWYDFALRTSLRDALGNALPGFAVLTIVIQGPRTLFILRHMRR